MRTKDSDLDPGSERAPASLDAWLEAVLPGYRRPGTLRKCGFGQSNPTFRLSSPSGRYILRRKPFGRLLPKAHAIEREFRVLRALQDGPVPVPKALALCEDPAVIGAAFYVMEFVEGRIFYDQRLPDMSVAERAEIFDGMNQAVAGLHQVRPADVGLSDFGRAEGFLARQVSTWTRQYRACEGEPIKAMEQLITWLPNHLPPEQPGRIFHGDLLLNNMVFHPTEARVIAILDWELSTLGDPFADLAHHMMVWRVPQNLFRGLAGLDSDNMGIPSEDEYLQRYLARTGHTDLPHWTFYLAFGLFRIAAILQGIWSRAQSGQASASDADEVGRQAMPLAELGWDIARSTKC